MSDVREKAKSIMEMAEELMLRGQHMEALVQGQTELEFKKWRKEQENAGDSNVADNGK